MGVWIEILFMQGYIMSPDVTPCVGVWIEIFILNSSCFTSSSLPAWECGLKSVWIAILWMT